jgi:hypothetical protein
VPLAPDPADLGDAALTVVDAHIHVRASSADVARGAAVWDSGLPYGSDRHHGPVGHGGLADSSAGPLPFWACAGLRLGLSGA